MSDHSTLQTFDLALRGGEVLLLAYIVALLLRDYGRIAAARLGAAFAVGTAASAVWLTPGFLATPLVWRVPILALATGNAVVFWLFASALFDDAFKPRPWHAVLWTAFCVIGIANCIGLPRVEPRLAHALTVAIPIGTLAFTVLAVAQSISNWRADLVEGRRKLRTWIVGSAAAYAILQTSAQLVFPGQSAGAVGALVTIAAMVAVTVLIGWQLFGPSMRELFFADAVNTPQAPPREGKRIGAETRTRASEPVDTSIVEAIEQVVIGERAYREPNLTIGALAKKLGLAEYKLRRAINRGLRYRNFNAFLNQYRIRDAKAALADPAKSETSVLEIALDCGFQSIGPFNRAFKTETGMTPSEFRRRNTGKPAAVLHY